MKKYKELLDLVRSCDEDFHKFYSKGNKTAGVRLRKKMQEIRILAKEIREDVQTHNSQSTELTNE